MAPELSARGAGRLGVALVALLLLAGGFALGRVTADDGLGGVETFTDFEGRFDPVDQPSAVDVGFAQDMATHHEQALLMAQLAMSRGSEPVRAIGQTILGTQAQEVGLFRGWLRVWGEPATSTDPMTWMGHEHGGAMPGMATPAQLDRLYRLTGRRFDALFLQLMVRHHEGGLEMTAAVLDLDPLPITRTAAEGISSEQLEELGVMRALQRSAS